MEKLEALEELLSEQYARWKDAKINNNKYEMDLRDNYINALREVISLQEQNNASTIESIALKMLPLVRKETSPYFEVPDYIYSIEGKIVLTESEISFLKDFKANMKKYGIKKI